MEQVGEGFTQEWGDWEFGVVVTVGHGLEKWGEECFGGWRNASCIDELANNALKFLLCNAARFGECMDSL